MKPRQILTAICTATLLFAACKKDDNTATPSPSPTPAPSTSNVIDDAKLKGKWEITSYYTITYDKATGAVKNANGVSQTYHDNGIGWNAAITSYMTFSGTDAYEHSNSDGSAASPIVTSLMPQKGKWLLKNSNKAISFEIKPAAGQTEITYQVAEFKDNYMHLSYKDSTSWTDAYSVNHLEFKK